MPGPTIVSTINPVSAGPQVMGFPLCYCHLTAHRALGRQKSVCVSREALLAIRCPGLPAGPGLDGEPPRIPSPAAQPSWRTPDPLAKCNEILAGSWGGRRHARCRADCDACEDPGVTLLACKGPKPAKPGAPKRANRPPRIQARSPAKFNLRRRFAERQVARSPRPSASGGSGSASRTSVAGPTVMDSWRVPISTRSERRSTERLPSFHRKRSGSRTRFGLHTKAS